MVHVSLRGGAQVRVVRPGAAGSRLNVAEGDNDAVAVFARDSATADVRDGTPLHALQQAARLP